MPPSYKKLTILRELDNTTEIDLRSEGINFIYIPNYVEKSAACDMFTRIESSGMLKQHSYIGPFGRRVNPHRLTYATVPCGRRYRYKGTGLVPVESDHYKTVIDNIIKLLPSEMTDKPDATVSNGYRYNGDDYIAPHVDDEKFMKTDNSTYWHDSTVCTLTLLRDPSQPMGYNLANPDTGVGYRLFPGHGSLIIQGRVLHEVLSETSAKNRDKIGRISVTLRKLQDQCSHGRCCDKATCPVNMGPSNYLYYSNALSVFSPASRPIVVPPPTGKRIMIRLAPPKPKMTIKISKKEFTSDDAHGTSVSP